MLVRFAELKAIQDVNEAEDHFNVARSHSQSFAFVHISHAKFALSQENTKRAIYILQSAIEVGAKPKEVLEDELQRIQTEKMQHSNLEVLSSTVKKGSDFSKFSRISDGTGELQMSSNLGVRTEASIGSDEKVPLWRSASQRKRLVGLTQRVAVVPFPIPENGDNYFGAKSSVGAQSMSRFPSGSNVISVSGLSSTKKNPTNGDPVTFQSAQSPDSCDGQIDSTPTLLNTRAASRMEDATFNIEEIVNTKSPEACLSFLKNLETMGNPQTDTVLNKIKDCYSKIFAKMPIRQFSKSPSYAKILVRYAELKSIEDPDDARDHFIVARSNCKALAFVHIAYAQFEVSQGNIMKASSILNKALVLNARPTELLDLALCNLKGGQQQLIPNKDDQLKDRQENTVSHVAKENIPPQRVPVNRKVELPTIATKDSAPEWKVPQVIRQVPPVDERDSPPDPRLQPEPLASVPTPSFQPTPRSNVQSVFQTPNNYRNPFPNSCITPVVKTSTRESSYAASKNTVTSMQQSTPQNKVCFQTPQPSIPTISNDSITIKGKQFFILKIIGRGGSSKVYQVLDQKKQLFAVKYVDLEDADPQTVESYKNEIEHLNQLQQYSDQIIKLYDYEITNGYIYMLMECGNLDLNTWLRNRKSVNPLERKFYWKNMLEAVQTIHKHGIVHSDLKPANFVIVNGSLKLIDFGIANKIQPDVTSIMKDSQVGTLNYMPPEAIKDTSSQGKARSKISPKGDVWSLGCILYCMTYGKTPFQSITNQIAKLQAIIDTSHKIDFPDISEHDLLDVLKRCLVRNPRERISIAELLEHPYLQLKPHASPVPERPCNPDLQKILTDLSALHSPNSIVRAANNLARMCSSGRKLDVAECAKSST
uniref:Protein kinase domain-containing protein n=1 Tax=Knipowitschia caucasica TaxID=637954 RepID=A0AAV2MBC7_KNICA